MKKYVISLDQGTTSSRAIVFDKNLEIVSLAQQEYRQIYPKPGYVEHDPMDIYTSQSVVLQEAILKAGIDPSEIAGIGITNQRETTILWDRKTGNPVYNAIVWQCRRTSDICAKMKEDGLAPMIKEKTGLVIDAYFSATKIKWILDNVDGARKKAENGELMFGTVDSWLVYKMSVEKAHVTDYTNASRTMLFNINTLEWDKDLLKLFDIPESILPEVVTSSELYGTYNIQGSFIPICGIAGDQQSSMFGQRCFEKGQIKNTYGTGCFMLMNTGDEIANSDSLVSTVGIGLKNRISYCIEGSVFIGGAVIQWLRDQMRFLKSSSESEKIAGSLKDNEGVYLVPAFTGLGAPYWDMNARGAIFGLTRGTTREHIVRAAVESMAYQTNDLLAEFEKSTGIKVKALKVDGGATGNNLLMQFQSDISNVPILRPKMRETTALGAALLAGLACGFYDENDIRSSSNIEEFHPSMDSALREKYISEWHSCVRRVL